MSGEQGPGLGKNGLGLVLPFRVGRYWWWRRVERCHLICFLKP